MSARESFHGLPIVAVVPKPKPGSEDYKLINWAIVSWRRASVGTGQNMAVCENAARELEIERDHGYIVHINRRTA